MVGQAVSLLVYARTDPGDKAIVDGTHGGMIFHKNVFRPGARGAQNGSRIDFGGGKV
jgi:predicted RNA-binding protein (virulence factor B family)